MERRQRTLIISCWAVLIGCFIIKLLGGDWFNIISNNQNFINICNYLDNSWIKYIVSTSVYVPSSYLIYLCLTKQKLFNDWWVMIILIPASYCKMNITFMGWIIDIFVWLILPLIKGKFKNWLWVISGIILIIAFQFISLLTRSININLTNETSLIALILQIDYYIMIILYYLYIQLYKRKE